MKMKTENSGQKHMKKRENKRMRNEDRFFRENGLTSAVLLCYHGQAREKKIEFLWREQHVNDNGEARRRGA